MKKFLIFILLAAAGYFGYEYLLKEKPVLEIKADKQISKSLAMDIDAPALAPPTYAAVQGTVKNVSKKALTNITLKYKLDAKPVEATIGYLAPGEEKSFSTQNIIIRNTGAPFFLEEMIYE